jgi:tetratricopeptide (TPR) repeat protein
LRYKHCHGSPDSIRPPQTNSDPLEAAKSLLVQGKLNEAVEACDSIIAKEGVNIATLRVLGQAVALLADVERTIDVWQSVLETVPDDPEALFHLGNAAKTSGENEKALNFFELGLKQNPEHIGLLNNVGLTLESIGRFDDAEMAFQKALDINENSFEIIANMAQNLYQQKRYQEALPWFDRLESQFNISDSAIWANYAVCMTQSGNLEGAYARFQQALKFDKSSASLYLDFGLVCSDMNRYDAASEAFKQCLSLNPESADALSALINCNQKMAVWENLDEDINRLINMVKGNDSMSRLSISPFRFLAICGDPELQKVVARDYVLKKIPHFADQKPGN